MGLLDTAKPFYRLEIFEPEASDPKYVVSPNVFLDNEKPSDDEQISSEIYLTSLNISLKLNGDINICELIINHNPGNAPVIYLDSKIKIYLGYYFSDLNLGPEYSLVFTGFIRRVQVHLQKTIIECRSNLYKLNSLKQKIAFSRAMTLDEIINKLAIDEGNLELADNGIFQTDITEQTGFSISDQKSLLDHIKSMANYSAFYIYMDKDDKFNADGWQPDQLQARSSDEEKEWISERNKDESSSSTLYKHELTFGRDIIASDFELQIGNVSAVEVVTLKPFSDDSVDTIEPPMVEFTPEDGVDPELPKKRFKISHVTREDAEKIAENLYYRLTQTLIGKAKVLGSPQIRLGDGVQIIGDIYEVPPFQNLDFSSGPSGEAELPNILFQVLKINHVLNDSEGFITKLEFVETRPTPLPEEGGEGGEGAGAGLGEGAGAEFTGTAAEGEEGLVNIRGILRDPNGNILANVDYSLECPTGEVLTGTTDANGEISYDDMPRGSYRIFYPRNLITNEDGEWVRVEGDTEEDSMDFAV